MIAPPSDVHSQPPSLLLWRSTSNPHAAPIRTFPPPPPLIYLFNEAQSAILNFLLKGTEQAERRAA